MKKIVLLISSALIVSACDPVVEISTPTVKPSVSVTENNINSPILNLKVTVLDEETKQPIPNASVNLLSDKSVIKKTDDKGNVEFNFLSKDTSYKADVTLNGYIGNIATVDNTKDTLVITIKKASFSLTGRVMANGLPVSGAVVSLGSISSFSDLYGNFIIKAGGSDVAQNSINVSKTGFNSTSIQFEKSDKSEILLGDILLNKRSLKPSIVFDISKIPFGALEGESMNLFSSLISLLEKNNFTVKQSEFDKSDLENSDIIVLPCPSLEYSSSELDTLYSLVRSGKKVIILGEWGGYGGFASKGLNSLLKKVNLQINTDVVEEISSENYIQSSDNVIISSFDSHALTKDLKKLIFYASSSVSTLTGGEIPASNTITPISTSSNSFRIQVYSKGKSSLVGLSLLGAGKIIVVGDTSMFTNSDSDSNSVINLLEADNSKFALNIFNL